MSLTCVKCSRVNPQEAAYCYYDGAALAGRAGGPINAGSAPFPNQFVFPDGLACRNFDQLAMARLSRATYALMVSLLPATATVVGVVVLAQIPSLGELGGVALVVGGVALHRE